jgi:glycosyltransferase involved in cell wall biosynthesis
VPARQAELAPVLQSLYYRTELGSRRSRVRLVAYTDNIERGGADVSMSHLLAQLEPAIEVAVVGVSREIVEWVAAARPGAATHVVPRPRSGHDWRSLRAHLSVLRRADPDILHVNLSSPWSCQYAIAAAEVLRRPRIVAVYQLPRPPRSRAQLRMKRLTARGVDRHVGVGERTSREIEETVGLPPESVLTIHNGVPDETRRPAARPRPGTLIGAIGRLEPQKGYDILIRALGEIEEATLVLVGEGSERPALEQLARSVGVADRIAWIGWSDDARSYLGTFDVFAFPSRFEGFPLAVLEALLARNAVVASDVGSIADAVRDNETGLLVPPEDPRACADAIRKLIADNALRTRLGSEGRRLVLARFTAEHMTRAFESLYDQLV